MSQQIITQTIAQLRDLYKTDKRQSTFNILEYGRLGTGKTYNIRTAVKPVLIDSFDPGGTKSLADEIAAGSIIVDSEFEGENPFEPKVWDAWERKFKERERMKLFDMIGTYVIDSGTMWVDAALNKFKKNKSGAAEIQEYNLRIIHVKANLKRCLNLPCNFILTAHPEFNKDEITGRVRCGPLMGKMTEQVPILFDEVYATTVRQTAAGPQYVFLTQPDGTYDARSRLGRKGVLQKYEEQDYKKLLAKAGRPTQDLPKL